jgi:hypothetical protein
MNVDRGDDYYNPVGRNNQVGEIINDMSEQDGVRLLSYALSTSEVRTSAALHPGLHCLSHSACLVHSMRTSTSINWTRQTSCICHSS